MSLTFKFDKSKEGEGQKKTGEDSPKSQKDIEQFDSSGHTRNICFVNTDGKQTFLNYAYLVGGEFNPIDNSISLTFTSHIVTLKGSNLDVLFDDININIVKRIKCLDKRYESTLTENEISVFEILIRPNS